MLLIQQGSILYNQSILNTTQEFALKKHQITTTDGNEHTRSILKILITS